MSVNSVLEPMFLWFLILHELEKASTIKHYCKSQLHDSDKAAQALLFSFIYYISSLIHEKPHHLYSLTVFTCSIPL